MIETFTGWGRWPKSEGYEIFATETEDVVAALSAAGIRGIIPRGAGRSYTDSALNKDGKILTLVDTTLTWKMIGIVRAAGATTLRQIQAFGAAAGYSLPVVPGTVDISVGGAVANDVHGKNHAQHGSFANCVQEIELLDGTGKQHIVSKDQSPDIFYATIGGIGLTGVILNVTCRMREKGSTMLTRIIRTGNLEQTLSALQNDDYEYGVAWVDINNRGRGIVTLGNLMHDNAENDNTEKNSEPNRIQLPAWAPERMLNTATIKILNEAQWRSSRNKEEHKLDINKFLYPLDRITNWNIMCGRHGFIQYQLSVPTEKEDAIERVLHIVKDSKITPFLSTIKRLGAASGGLLSFPSPGWTLAFDIILSSGDTQMTHLRQVLKQCDRAVIEAGGRVYLANDAFLDVKTFNAMYPRSGEFQNIRQKLDPNQHLQSDLGRRLGLVTDKRK